MPPLHRFEVHFGTLFLDHIHWIPSIFLDNFDAVQPLHCTFRHIKVQLEVCSDPRLVDALGQDTVALEEGPLEQYLGRSITGSCLTTEDH